MTHDEFVSRLLHPETLYRLSQISIHPWDMPDIEPVRDIRITLEKKYREREWSGYPPYNPRQDWVWVSTAIEKTGIPASFFYESLKVGLIKNCQRGPEKTRKGITQNVWRFDLDEATALREQKKVYVGEAPDRIIVDGVAYASFSALSKGNNKIAHTLIRLYNDGRLAGFKRQYTRHAVYIKESEGLLAIEEYRERKRKKREGKIAQLRIIEIVRRKGPIHKKAISAEIDNVKPSRIKYFLSRLVNKGEIIRVDLGWYAIKHT